MSYLKEIKNKAKLYNSIISFLEQKNDNTYKCVVFPRLMYKVIIDNQEINDNLNAKDFISNFDYYSFYPLKDNYQFFGCKQNNDSLDYVFFSYLSSQKFTISLFKDYSITNIQEKQNIVFSMYNENTINVETKESEEKSRINQKIIGNESNNRTRLRENVKMGSRLRCQPHH